jgi:hypothetical protein
MEWNYEGYIDSYGIPVFETPTEKVKDHMEILLTDGVIDYWKMKLKV